jgi:hypothetical protein
LDLYLRLGEFCLELLLPGSEFGYSGIQFLASGLFKLLELGLKSLVSFLFQGL